MSDILRDILELGLTVVFCGTAVGPKSAAKGAYYAGPGNRFWSVLAECGMTPSQLDPSEFATLPRYGIGLTDLVKTQAALDAGITDAWDLVGFREKIERFEPDLVAFNGKRAGQQYFGTQVSYGLQTAKIGSASVFVLPSTSAMAKKFWDVKHWESLAETVSRKARRAGLHRHHDTPCNHLDARSI